MREWLACTSGSLEAREEEDGSAAGAGTGSIGIGTAGRDQARTLDLSAGSGVDHGHVNAVYQLIRADR